MAAPRRSGKIPNQRQDLVVHPKHRLQDMDLPVKGPKGPDTNQVLPRGSRPKKRWCSISRSTRSSSQGHEAV